MSSFKVRLFTVGMILQANLSSGIAVGLDVFVGEHHRPLGYGSVAPALFGEDGLFVNPGSEYCKYTSSFGQGDIIGCGIDYSRQRLFYTKNGKCLGKLPGFFAFVEVFHR